MTYKEISAWMSALVTLVLYSYYLLKAPYATTQGAALGLFLTVAFAMVVAEIVLQTIASLLHKPERTDERDKLISAKAARNSSFILMAGIVIACMHLIAPTPLAEYLWHMSQPALAVHILILTAAAGEFVRYSSTIVYYRRGA